MKAVVSHSLTIRYKEKAVTIKPDIILRIPYIKKIEDSLKEIDIKGRIIKINYSETKEDISMVLDASMYCKSMFVDYSLSSLVELVFGEFAPLIEVEVSEEPYIAILSDEDEHIRLGDYVIIVKGLSEYKGKIIKLVANRSFINVEVDCSEETHSNIIPLTYAITTSRAKSDIADITVNNSKDVSLYKAYK